MMTAGWCETRQPAAGMKNKKGESYVVDNRFDTYNFMGTRVGDRLYDWLFYSCPAGHCHYHCADQSHSGAKTCINDFLI